MPSLPLLLLLSAAASAADAPQVSLYGALRPTLSFADGAVASYGRPNEAAITAAANPRIVADAEAARLSWQVAQSRFGLRAKAGQATGVLELDFIDFNVASPTVGAKPRLRIATVDWAFAPGTHLTVGQTWDAFAPLNPLHRNLVGGSFQAGNVGFMRQQAILDHKAEAVHLTAAVGMAGSNNGLADGGLELTPAPSATGRAGLRVGEAGELALSGFWARVGLQDAEGAVQHTQAWGALASAELKPAPRTQLRGEAFVGQDLQSTGMLSLAQARLGPDGGLIDLREAGGWISLRQGLGPRWAVSATAHGDAVLDPDQVAANYVPAEDPAAVAALDVNLGPGLRANLGGRVGVERQANEHLVVFVEGFGLQSSYAAAEGAGRGGLDPLRLGAELGALFTF